jgi:hypothetical protein
LGLLSLGFGADLRQRVARSNPAAPAAPAAQDPEGKNWPWYPDYFYPPPFPPPYPPPPFFPPPVVEVPVLVPGPPIPVPVPVPFPPPPPFYYDDKDETPEEPNAEAKALKNKV